MAEWWRARSALHVFTTGDGGVTISNRSQHPIAGVSLIVYQADGRREILRLDDIDPGNSSSIAIDTTAAQEPRRDMSPPGQSL
jgi:hypothetical protein